MAQITRIKSDFANYSRYDTQRNVVTAICYLANVAAGDTVSVNLVRQDGYGTVATATSAPLSAGQTACRIPIALEQCLDPLYPVQKIHRAKSGQYTLADAQGTVVSPVFTVSLVSVRRFREEICRGLPLRTGETVGPLEPLATITGVTVTATHPNTMADIYSFSYTHTAQTLSWGGGPAVNVSAGGHFRLIDANGHFWVSVTVDDTLLPAADATDMIPFDEQEFTDAQILTEIQYAQDEVAGWLGVYVEPTQVATAFMLNYLQSPLVQFKPEPTTFADVILGPVNYTAPPTASNWLSLQIPARNLIQLEGLLGMMNDTTVLDVDQGWWQWSERNALIQLVPRQGVAVAWIYYNVFYYSFLLGAFDYVPNFWHYKATVGLRDLYERRRDVLQAIEYTAAIKVLRQAGLHAKPGYVQESLNRDGVSQSISYSTGKGGIYNAIIDSYAEQLTTLRSALPARITGYRLKLL